jgi:hypothetical protein
MTTFTREDFEMAAKAAGLTVEWDGDGFVVPQPFKGYTNYEPWNPRDDDGDAMRLASRLNLTMKISDSLVEVIRAGTLAAASYMSTHRTAALAGMPVFSDKDTATRHAIFRAAIVIGRAMP